MGPTRPGRSSSTRIRMTGVKAEVIAETPAGVVVHLRRREPERAKPIDLFQVLRLRDGKVADMQDFERRGPALKAAAAERAA